MTEAMGIAADQAQTVPNSAGTARPKLRAPANACDCHIHIYDPERFAFTPSSKVAPRHATAPDYRLLQRRLGTTRGVIVTPRNYATDNRATVDAIAQLGKDGRGIAVLRPTVTERELEKLHQAGVRGTRLTLGDPASAIVNPTMIAPLASRVAELGWHVQLNVSGDQIVELVNILERLPCQLVFDHMANPSLPAGIGHPSHKIVRRLIDSGRAWVKLSGAYLNSQIGPPSYPEATAIARAFVKASPERLLWGSDWPHPSLADDHKPNDANLFDLLSEWAPQKWVRHRILVQNPAELYGFGK
ncbi:MAG: amidohydrolase family protein [Bryobacteraceae bacterium]